MAEQYKRIDFMQNYGVIPLSIWDISDQVKYNNTVFKHLKERGSSTREGTAQYFDGAGKKTKFKSTTSYFNPYLAKTIIRSYCPPEGNIYDPFSSIVRPYIAAKEQRRYVGCEVRKEEIEKTLQKIQHLDHDVDIYNKDCRQFITDEKFDLIFTCPPYWNHEKYSDLSTDMSTIDDYSSFLKEYETVFSKCEDMLKEDGFCVFVVADFRDYSDGRNLINRVVPFVADTIKSAENAGLILYDKVIVKKPLGTAPSRTKMWNTRKTVNIHEEVLVFRKTMDTPEWTVPEKVETVNPFW